jgi:hypothetical protein
MSAMRQRAHVWGEIMTYSRARRALEYTKRFRLWRPIRGLAIGGQSYVLVTYWSTYWLRTVFLSSSQHLLSDAPRRSHGSRVKPENCIDNLSKTTNQPSRLLILLKTSIKSDASDQQKPKFCYRHLSKVLHPIIKNICFTKDIYQN